MLHTVHACVHFDEMEHVHKRETLIGGQFEDITPHGILDAHKQLQRHAEPRELGNVECEFQAIVVLVISLSPVICSAEDSTVRCKVGQKRPLCSDVILQALHISRFEKVPPSEFIDRIQYRKSSSPHRSG